MSGAPDRGLPNFFLAGAPRAGTTSLYHYLGQHPDVYVSPVKEPHFFAPEVLAADPDNRRSYESAAPLRRALLAGTRPGPPADWLVLDESEYRGLFAAARAERAIGEGSVGYLASAGAAARIRARVPRARIILLLRDPAECLYAHYCAAFDAGVARQGLGEWLEDQARREAAPGLAFGPLGACRYGSSVARMLAAFPLEQVHVLRYEEFRDAPHTALSGLFRFLGVAADFRADLTVRHHVTRRPRWPRLWSVVPPRLRRRFRPPPHGQALGPLHRALFELPAVELPAGFRARVRELLGDEIRALQDLLARDFSAWLT